MLLKISVKQVHLHTFEYRSTQAVSIDIYRAVFRISAYNGTWAEPSHYPIMMYKIRLGVFETSSVVGNEVFNL